MPFLGKSAKNHSHIFAILLMMLKLSYFFLSAVLLVSGISVSAQICRKPFHIVIIGSSTAAGNGASSYAHSWAGKFTDSLKKIDSGYLVDNLAVAGTTTYEGQPNAYKPPAGRPSPLAGHNISAALALHPDAIIINYPSNDAANGFTLKEQKDNFKRMTARADSARVPVWVATPQPRDNFKPQQINRQHDLLVWIESYYEEKAIDFHSGLATAKDSIRFKYSSGDGIHLNNEGHEILYQRVLAADIPDTLCARNPGFLFSLKQHSEKKVWLCIKENKN